MPDEGAEERDPWILGLEFPPTIAQSYPCTHPGPTAQSKHKENNFAPAKAEQEMETVIRERQGEISQHGP